MKFKTALAALFFSGGSVLLAQDASRLPGTDIAQAFAQASDGAPLRVVALGGSITQAGEGWIGPWLRETFPRSAIYLHNAGVGGTGSDFGRARLERDGLVYDPDLVMIEFCVNDSSRPDEEVIGDLEALIIRLKSLPRPPAILFLIAAQEKGLNKERFHRVANHYGLLAIDLDAAMHAYLEKMQKPWTDLMEDAVHPNEKGHAFYASIIAERLQQLPPLQAGYSLPAPMSPRLPALDTRMIPLRSAAPGWQVADPPPGRVNRSFLGLISATEPGTTLTFPFRGTEVGLMYLNHPDFGSFFASVDGGIPRQIFTNLYEGYGFVHLAKNLSPGEHRLEIVLPSTQPPGSLRSANGPVKLGYVLLGEGEGGRLTPPGNYPAETLQTLRFQPLAASSLAWIGPFGKAGNQSSVANLTREYPPEAPALKGKWGGAFPGMGDAPLKWKNAAASGSQWELQTKDRPESASVYYVATRLVTSSPGEVLLRIEGERTFQAWLNGNEVLPISTARGDRPFILPLSLSKGPNSLLLKAGSGQGECRLSLAIASTKTPPPVAESPLERP